MFENERKLIRETCQVNIVDSFKEKFDYDNNLLIIFCYFRFDQESQTVIPVRVNISISIKDILQIKEIDHTYTLKVIISIFPFN